MTAIIACARFAELIEMFGYDLLLKRGLTFHYVKNLSNDEYSVFKEYCSANKPGNKKMYNMFNESKYNFDILIHFKVSKKNPDKVKSFETIVSTIQKNQESIDASLAREQSEAPLLKSLSLAYEELLTANRDQIMATVGKILGDDPVGMLPLTIQESVRTKLDELMKLEKFQKYR